MLPSEYPAPAAIARYTDETAAFQGSIAVDAGIAAHARRAAVLGIYAFGGSYSYDAAVGRAEASHAQMAEGMHVGKFEMAERLEFLIPTSSQPGSDG